MNEIEKRNILSKVALGSLPPDTIITNGVLFDVQLPITFQTIVSPRVGETINIETIAGREEVGPSEAWDRETLGFKA
jgi:hypothetical protein